MTKVSREEIFKSSTSFTEFGAKFRTNYNGTLPITMLGTEYSKPQIILKSWFSPMQSLVILAALNTPGKTIIKAKKSRDYTELFLKYLKLPIKLVKKQS